jgi:valyl-tRNA synthetase
VSETLALQLWEHGAKSDPAPSLVVSRWPAPGARDAGLEDRFGLAIEVVRRIRERRQEANVDARAKVQVALGGEAGSLRPFTDIIASLTTSDVRFGGGDTAPTLVRAVEVRVDVPRDTASDRARLERELEQALALLENTRTLLGSEFAKKAPPALIEKERAKLVEREAAVASLRAELAKK